MEVLVMGIFCLILLGSIALQVPIVMALLIGLALFFIYGLKKGFSLKALFHMSLSGIKTVKNILLTFVLIGILTAMWRASGCIPTIVSYASDLINPSIFILLTFLLNAMLSILTGTSFGTSATMGVICVSIARSMGLSVFWVGGAVLAGAYFGDRCSPVSTSALLVATLTETDIYANIKNMIKTAIIPFFITCAIYGIVGMTMQAGQAGMNVEKLFGEAFQINLLCLLPAIVVLLLALCRVKVKRLMFVSIVIAVVIAIFVQGMSVQEVIKASIMGFSVSSEKLSGMINGGGIRSMLKVGAIVCIASSYADIFKKTGLLSFMEKLIEKLNEKWGAFPIAFLVSCFTSMIACNQTLAIMLTSQLCVPLYKDSERRALDMEDTVVVIAPLIPWSIAGTVALASAGAPSKCLITSCFLYVLPLWRLISGSKLFKSRKK